MRTAGRRLTDGAARRHAALRTAGRRGALAGAVLAALLLVRPAARAQGPNYTAAPVEIEARLAHQPFAVVAIQDNRWEGDRTQRALLRFPDGARLAVKWARSVPGGSALNNQPRYEVAAYELQKLFLDEADWVVPPTVMRALPLEVFRLLEPGVEATFDGTASVVVALQYWLRNVRAAEGPDLARAEREADYAHRLECLNLLTYLIRHVDSNPGNVLVSTAGEPRLFAVDNGVAFRSPESPRGTQWKRLWVRRLPAAAVDRLRALDRDALERRLYVVAQFEVRDGGRLEAVPATARLDPNRGVARQGDVIQLGLTDLEVDELLDRLRTLLARVDAGEIELH